MTHTQDFEHVLDLENVVGVEYDEENDTVTTFVTTKKSEEELDESQLVANNVSGKKSSVIEIGEIYALHQDIPSAQGDRRLKHRPVPGGVSEMNINGTAATGGPYKATVTDPSKGKWADNVDKGDTVRLSNNHVYAMTNQADFGEAITQPSPYDGGTAADTVGELVGYVPLEDGAVVDLAARSTTDETTSYHNIDQKYPTGICRDDYSSLKGETLVKTGRTTGVQRGDVRGANASVRVNYGDGQMFTMRDQIIANDMSDGGDSGSAVFHEDSKELVGQVFAGNDTVTVIHKASNIEDQLGVELMTETDENTDKQYVESLKTTVQISMEEHNLDLVQLDGDKPKSGETITATADVSGNYSGTAYLTVQGERYEFDLDEDNTASVDVEITAPDEYNETFDVDIAGGYVK